MSVTEINTELLDLQNEAAEVGLEIIQDGGVYRIQHLHGVTSIPMTAEQVRTMIAYKRSHQ